MSRITMNNALRADGKLLVTNRCAGQLMLRANDDSIVLSPGQNDLTKHRQALLEDPADLIAKHEAGKVDLVAAG